MCIIIYIGVIFNMKRKIKIKNVVLLVVVLAFIAACVFIFLNGEKTFFENHLMAILLVIL